MTLGVCAREGVCEQLSCPSSLLCLFCGWDTACGCTPRPERLSARATLFPKGSVITRAHRSLPSSHGCLVGWVPSVRSYHLGRAGETPGRSRPLPPLHLSVRAALCNPLDWHSWLSKIDRGLVSANLEIARRAHVQFKLLPPWNAPSWCGRWGWRVEETETFSCLSPLSFFCFSSLAPLALPLPSLRHLQCLSIKVTMHVLVRRRGRQGQLQAPGGLLD